jgi:hypothetical protein
LNKEVGQGKHAKYFIKAWQGKEGERICVGRPERDNKVSKAVTFLIDHALEWWNSKNAQ